MHKFIIFLAFFAAISISNATWVGTSAGTWNTAANWSPAVVPNSTTSAAIISTDQGAGAKTIAMSTTPETVNKIKFTNTTSDWTVTGSGAGVLTLGGVNAEINATHVGGISAPTTVTSSVLNLTGTANINLTGLFTASSKTINNSNTGTVTFNHISNVFTGTTINHTGKCIAHGSGSLPAGAMNWTNAVAGTCVGWVGGGAMGMSVAFIDTGANDFNLGGTVGACAFGAAFSGTITHNLIMTACSPMNNTWTGMTFSGGAKVIIIGGTSTLDDASFPSTVEVDLGDSNTSTGSLQYDGSTTFANLIHVRPKATGTAGTFNLNSLGTPNTNFSGNIVLNADANSAAGATFAFAVSGAITNTISGVISNGASGAANITFANSGGSTSITTISGTNTYTSPTTISSGTMNVTGSIGSSSLVTVSGTGTLKGSGTVGPVTTSGASPSIQARSSVSPSTSQVLTISGNLDESASTTTAHTFQIAATNLSSRLQINGNVSLKGTVSVSSTISGSYVIANYTGTSTGTWTSSVGTISDVAGVITLTIP